MFGLCTAAPVTAFENLDFEETLFDFETWDPLQPFNDQDVFDPTIVTPGWSFRAENLDYSVLESEYHPDGYYTGYPVHGALIVGHIGETTNIILSFNGDYGFGVTGSSLQGRHSLTMMGDISGGPLESPLPVAFQDGVVPAGTRSIRIQVGGSFSTTESFSVRFNGYPVDMTAIASLPAEPFVPPEYPPNWELQNQIAELQGQPIPYPALMTSPSTLFAGNIESIAGLRREMAIRPEPEYNSDANQYFTTFMAFDNVRFSTIAAPGPAVQAPEPGALGLAASVGILTTAMRRRRRVRRV